MSDSEVKKSSFISIIRGAGFFFTGEIISNIFGFISNLLLTQVLGPGGYGVYTFARTIASTIESVANLGTDKAVLRFVSTNEGDRESQLGISYIIATIGGICIGGALFFGSSLVSSYTLENSLLTAALQLLSLFLILKSVINVTSSAFRAIDRPELTVFLKQVLQKAFILIGLGSALLLSLPFIEIVAAVVVSTMLTTLSGFYILYQKTSLRPSLPTKNISIKSYLSYSIPLAFKDAGSIMFNRIDILIVGTFLASSSVGYYRVAILLSSLLTLPLNAVNQIFPPVIARLYSNEQQKEMAEVFKTSTRWILTATFPAAVGLVVFRNEILTLFGSEFSKASTLLIIFAIGQIANTAVGPCGYVLMMTDRHFVVTANQWVFGAMNLSLNIIFIQWFGTIGAAVATAGTLSAMSIAKIVELYHFEQIHPFSLKLIKPFLATVLSGLLMFMAQFTFSSIFSLFVGGAIGVIGYGIAIFALGVEDNDRELAHDILS